MKKTKLTVGLVTTFIAALGISACNSTTTSVVTDGKGAVVGFKGYEGETIELKADDLYGEYLKDPSKVSSFYESVVENLIRYTYKETTFVEDNNKKTEEERLVLLKTYGKIESDASLAVRKAKEKAQSNAKSNGTTYQEEWNSILSENGCENEDELLQTYIYKYEKEEYDRWFLATNIESLKTNYISGGTDVASKFPYHIRHILISIDGGSNEYTRGTITQTEAENIAIIMGELIDDTKVGGTNSYLFPFGKVAIHSGDTGSGAKGGDVGIMSTSTSFVNEFKLGIYAYDAVLSGINHTKAGAPTVDEVKKGVGITAEIETQLKGFGLATVPYDAFIQIGNFAKDTQDENKLDVNDNNASYYPRNVLYNNYLNLHQPFVITNQKLDLTTGLIGKDTSTSERFNEDGILTDEEGRIIIGVRSEHGIHLMIMQKSIFNDEITPEAGSKTDVTLSQYYTTYSTNDIHYPGNKWKTDDKGKKVIDNTDAKTTYVNYISSEDNGSSRASEVESEIKGFDQAYSYRTYEGLVSYLEGQGKTLTFAADINKVINTYISTVRLTNKINSADDIANAWQTYLRMLELETYNRDTVVMTDQTIYDANGQPYADKIDLTRLINPICAVRFQKARSDKNYQKGGVCYYEK